MFEIVHKPAFYHDLFSIPKEVQKRISGAVERIRHDPFWAGGKVNRCLKHRYQNLYRYRIGDYRLVYSVGNRCLCLLAIGHRSEVYDRFQADPADTSPVAPDAASAEPQLVPTTVYDTPPAYPGDDEESNDAYAGDSREDGNEGDELRAPFVKTPQLLQELLDFWGVPSSYHEPILQCESIDELLDLDVPDDVKEKLLHWYEPPRIEQILEQPTMELREPKDLDRYMEGSLKRFLLKLDPEQERVASRALRGPTLVKGGPGTGKSLVALYRIKNLLEAPVQRQLFAEPRPRILLVTYTRSLINVSRELLTELLGGEPDELDVTNLDRKVKQIVLQHEGAFSPASPTDKAAALTRALDWFSSSGLDPAAEVRLRTFRPDFLLDEFDWVIEGRALPSLEAYWNEDRTGRGIALDKTMRSAIWAVHEKYLEYLQEQGLATWDVYRQRAAAIVRSGGDVHRYDVVVVDEAQDLTPAGLRLCVELCRDPAGLYLTADASQSIYNRGFSWGRVHEDLQVRGRTTILKRNYRSTRQIAEAAAQLLRDHGGGDEEALAVNAVRTGPKPVLVGCLDEKDELRVIASFLKEASHSTRLPVASGAVLTRKNRDAEEIAVGLEALGIPARYMKSGEVSLDVDHVKVMTIHTAKGLEFPFVAVARVNDGVLPRLPSDVHEEEYDELLAAERRLLYVALSRAMRRLLVTYDRSTPSPFLAELDESLWSRERPPVFLQRS